MTRHARDDKLCEENNFGPIERIHYYANRRHSVLRIYVAVDSKCACKVLTSLLRVYMLKLVRT